MTSAPELSVPPPVGRRGILLLAIAVAGVAAYGSLGLSLSELAPRGGGARVVAGFFSRALTPALSYESDVPPGTLPILLKAFSAMRRTIVFAAAAMSLAVLFGLLLGFPASTAWWAGDPAGAATRAGRFLRRSVAPVVYGGTRTLIALMRSVHELLWAALLLVAFGFNTFSAVIAIAIPYGGTLAKIFSEMIDEAKRDSAEALRAAGATPAQVFFFGLLPRALPDMAAYTFYRFECAVRSSAILGFFGFETLGYHIKASFDNLHYGEVWTYLYTLVIVIVILEVWSSGLRRRFVGYE